MNFWPSFGKAKPQVEPDDTDEEIGVPKTVEESPAKDNAPTLASAKTEDTTDSEESNKEGAPKKEEDEPVLEAEEPEQVLDDVEAYLRGKSLLDHVFLFQEMQKVGNWEVALQIALSANKFSDQDKDNLMGEQELIQPLRECLNFDLAKAVMWLEPRLRGVTADAAEFFSIMMRVVSSADKLPDDIKARLFEDNRIVVDHGYAPQTLEVIAKSPEYLEVFCLAAKNSKSMLTNDSCAGIREILAVGNLHGKESKLAGDVRDAVLQKAKKGNFPIPVELDLKSLKDTYLEDPSVYGSNLLKKPSKKSKENGTGANVPVISGEVSLLLANCFACAYRQASIQVFGKTKDVLTDARYHPNLKEIQGKAVAKRSINFLTKNICYVNQDKLEYVLQSKINEFFNAKQAAKPAEEEPSGKAESPTIKPDAKEEPTGKAESPTTMVPYNPARNLAAGSVAFNPNLAGQGAMIPADRYKYEVQLQLERIRQEGFEKAAKAAGSGVTFSLGTQYHNYTGTGGGNNAGGGNKTNVDVEAFMSKQDVHNKAVRKELRELGAKAATKEDIADMSTKQQEGFSQLEKSVKKPRAKRTPDSAQFAARSETEGDFNEVVHDLFGAATASANVASVATASANVASVATGSANNGAPRPPANNGAAPTIGRIDGIKKNGSVCRCYVVISPDGTTAISKNGCPHWKAHLAKYV